mmetsp:Transcript_3862/g.6441  ORF Transcript_3862/g.6441 Transcript_3862/m.6441 type:complete len:329 (-) Transcript_3862:471-1457(-)
MNRPNRWNIYSAKGNLPSSTRRRCIIAASCCFSIFLILLIFNRILQQLSLTSSNEIREKKCRLKQAIQSGECQLFSHRSYYNAKTDDCRNAMEQLKRIGVHHLDLDLVLTTTDKDDGIASNTLIVAHPMEYKHTTPTYSPCGNTPFNEMINLLKTVYNDNFFISMEPKAAWRQTTQELNDVALIHPPSRILEKLLELIEFNELAGHCAAIVELNYQLKDEAELHRQEELLRRITQHCQLFKGIRLSDDVDKLHHDVEEYDAIMPTIELHSRHPRNVEGKVMQQELWSKSIVWVVDNEVDLEFAADVSPRGIVSNTPQEIVRILEGWCQ